MSLADWMEAGMQDMPVPAGVEALSGEILTRYGEAVLAVIYYGSCRRGGDAGEGLADLLVLVDSYRAVHGARPMALANRMLPPNVYYLETGNKRYRSKYAIITLTDFERRCRRGLDAYFWARFAQPAQLAFGRDEAAVSRIARARANAASRFCTRAAGLFTGEIDATAFWVRSLQASYRCELRPEKPAAAERLVEADGDYYRELSTRLIPALPFVTALGNGRFRFVPSLFRRLAATAEWAIRRIWGKALNVARLFKAAGTFSGGVDYLLWKVERHSGVRVEPTDFMRRHPRLAAFELAWKLRRQGGFK